MSLRGSGFKVLGPWWLVAAIVAAGVLVIAGGHLRSGGQLMAAGFGLGALIRLIGTRRRAGGLAVRSRVLDVVILLALAIGVLIASATVKLDTDGQPRSAVSTTAPATR